MKKHASSLGIALSLFVTLTSTAYAVERGDVMKAKATSTGITRSCQARETAVKTRLESLVNLAAKMQSVFDSHSLKVQSYYKDVVLPTGKTVTNYDQLVTTITTKKTAVETALNKAKADVAAFSCTTGDPRTLLQTFRTDMQTVKRALKDYRTAIKNLIVAIHRVTPTAAPTASPTTQGEE